MFPLKNTEAYIHANGFRSTLGKELADRDAEINELGSEIQALTNYVTDTGVKNLLENTASSQVKGGVTFVVNDDKSITADATETVSSIYFQLHSYSNDEYQKLFAGKTLKISGTPSNAASGIKIYAELNGTGVIDEINAPVATLPTTSGTFIVYIRIPANSSVSNLVFKPMLTDANIPNSDYAHYQPYAKTNVELTQELPHIESGTTAFTNGNEKVNFSKAFSTAPNVIAIPKYTTVTTGETPLLLKVYDVTTTYFRVRAIDNTGANVSTFTNVTSFMWYAMG